MLKIENMFAPDTELECNGKCYTFRAMDLGDKVWLSQEYGAENVPKLLTNGDLAVISRIAYRLLKDKSSYGPQTVSDYNEDGIKITSSIGGVKLFCAEFKGNSAIIKLAGALEKAMMAGEPIQDGTLEPVSSQGTEETESPL